MIGLTIALAIMANAAPTHILPVDSFYVGDSVGTYLLHSTDHVDSVRGRRLEEAVIPAVQPGDTLIVELGTNNLLEPDSWHHVEHIVEQVPVDVCLWWVTPYHAYYPAETAAFAAHVEQFDLTPNGCGGVIPWHLLGRADLTTDLVHPNAAGAFYLSAVIDQSTNPNPQPLG